MPSATHPPESPFQVLAGRLAQMVILLYVAQLTWWAVSADILELLAIVPDDTAYYLQIARHAATGAGFTFDGLHPTNGYQPLWQWLLVPVFAVIRLGPEAMLRLVLVLQSLLLGGALLGLVRVLGRSVPGQVLLPGAVIHGFVVLVMGVDGMETALLATGLALLVTTALGGPGLPQRHARRPVDLGSPSRPGHAGQARLRLPRLFGGRVHRRSGIAGSARSRGSPAAAGAGGRRRQRRGAALPDRQRAGLRRCRADKRPPQELLPPPVSRRVGPAAADPAGAGAAGAGLDRGRARRARATPGATQG
ncbi:MAG: hypothetical protein IPO18_03830 [bacterium]|nr:hypothetical protein [bacterium]